MNVFRSDHAVASDALDGFYRISKHSLRCLDVARQNDQDAAPIVQGTCWGGPNPSW